MESHERFSAKEWLAERMGVAPPRDASRTKVVAAAATTASPQPPRLALRRCPIEPLAKREVSRERATVASLHRPRAPSSALARAGRLAR